MIPLKIKKTDHQSYPGLYKPIRENKDILIARLETPDVFISKPPINITEAEGMYRIDFSIPGFKREQIFIETKGDRVFIEAGNQREPLNQNEYCRTMEFDCEYIRREVVVPGNVDTGFLSAEYKDGILTISMYQTHSKIHNDVAEIAVY
ncbi:Hsp20/alpha crystallin family protein [Flavitalea sp.]|nr:Hsp20/alpha crystallin family protein [Flavitalea sp.]